jgi:type II secretory pathway component GspD/PulD (secretin)
MTPTAAFAGRRMTLVCLLSTLTLIAFAPRIKAQNQPAEAKPAPPAMPHEFKTFYPINATQGTENDIVTDLRNMIPNAKIYVVSSLGAITIRGTADDLEMAQHIIADIDRPVKTYQLTFTLNESGSGNPASSRHIAMVIQVGNKSEVKLGSKVPIVTGSFDDQTSKANTQVQYEDVGLMIEAWLDSSGDSLRLHTKVEQSNVSDEKSNVGIQDPVLLQSVFDGSSTLVEGRPQVLGTLETPGGSGKVEIEVIAEPVK